MYDERKIKLKNKIQNEGEKEKKIINTKTSKINMLAKLFVNAKSSPFIVFLAATPWHTQSN